MISSLPGKAMRKLVDIVRLAKKRVNLEKHVNNSSANKSILTKLLSYLLSIIIIIYTKNALNLSNRY